MLIDFARFGGCQPKKDPILLDPDLAESASRIDPSSGALDPEVIAFPVGSVSKSGTIKTIYWHVDKWLHWTSDVDVVRTPTAGDTDDRIIYTGDGAPKITDYTLANTGGGTDYPKDYYTLGIPQPTIASSLSVGGGSGQQEARTYVHTLVSDWDEEGPPSDPKTATGFINGTWNYNGMQTTVSGDYNITAKRIYRTITNNAGEAEYHFVAEVTLATANYADTNSNATVAANDLLPSADWIAPDTTMAGLAEMPGEFLAGFIPGTNIVCFSEPGQPHAWPTKYQYPVGFPVVAIKVSGFNLFVTTTGLNYVFSGSHPGEMAVTKGDNYEPNVSKRATVELRDGIAYPSPNGLIVQTVSGTRNVTEDILRRDQWQFLIGYSSELATVQGDLMAARYRGKYLFHNASSGANNSDFFVIDPQRPAYYRGPAAYLPITTTPSTLAPPGALFVNREFEEQFYLTNLEKVVWLVGWTAEGMNLETLQFDAFTANVQFDIANWTSRRVRVPKPAAFQFLRVEADQYAIPDWLRALPNARRANLRMTKALDHSPIGCHMIGETHGIGAGTTRPIITTAGYAQTLPFAPTQGWLRVDVLAGNHQGNNAPKMDALSVIASAIVTDGKPIKIPCRENYDVWQVRISATCRVRRVQLAESVNDFRRE